MPSARVHISGLGPDESETAPGAVDAPVPPFEFYTSTIEPSASGFALAAILEASLEHVTREADAPTCPHAYVHLWDLRKCDKCGADVGDDRREPKAKEEGLRPLRTLNATFSLRRLSTGPAAAPVKFAVTRKTVPTKTQVMAADRRASAFSGRPLWPRAARLITTRVM